ncbi:MAG TPA: gliding motility-associated C-terminal domain-containing protein, partial [Mucilaginibacter sp.]|nr:gliding motility-associated C-terminal domain-containing protein [Mucilaginibacter sp.]
NDLQAQQNLVPNWSFESLQNFPPACMSGNIASVDDAIGWINPNNAQGPCVFNEIDTILCFTNTYPTFGVPSNQLGWQKAHTGKGYANIQALGLDQSFNNRREYVQTKLVDSLKKNKSYCMSFFVSLMDSFSNYSTSRVGCYISSIAINNFSQQLISVIPQIENPFNNFITSKTNWTLIQGIYLATGGENYITIGNFYDDANTDTLFSPGIGSQYNNPGDHLSGYYVDDVSLVEYNKAYVGQDTTLCSILKFNRNLSNTFGAQYNWSVLNGDINSIDSIHSYSPTFSPTVATTYILQKQQCGITSYDTLIVRIPAIHPAKTGNDTTICEGDTLIISAVNNCSWCNHWWNNGVQTLQIKVAPKTTTTYQFYQTDSCGTTDDPMIVNVKYCKFPVVIPPNVFTPNQDGINDVWLPQIQNELSLSQYNFAIFDRWGLKIFETNQYGTGWDGHTTSGIECNDGTYYYVLSYSDIQTNESRTMKGFIQLIK